jgi:uncharacterized protein YqiB (DUF1249 family)
MRAKIFPTRSLKDLFPTTNEMQKSAVESLAKMRYPLESSNMTLETPVLKIIFDQVDPDLIKWTDGTELDQNGA